MAWIERVLKTHKPSDKEASIYGVLLFTDTHAHVKKVVYDDDYWRALDEISGDLWPIFCTRAEPGTYVMPSPPPGILAMMVPVWEEPRANKELLEAFELENTEKLPCLIVFAREQHGSYLKNVMTIKGSTEQEAFNSMSAHIQTVSDALKEISPKNLRNPLGVHSATSLAITHAEDWELIKNGVKLWQWFKSIK
ncbi:hypothetical protein D8Y20_03680 [Mariprofundus sp. EBB-1]|uniref:hypothetical protein n=1 Tax=Mariprofundus sp. EBB-1 TaxID=2650971 RepID=UPI000EF251A4|nr:hypothetical protein [Mariprofundus sp. EBB-1]RLL54381.1 hypothetical protein D8Y20_03680 [Mariprofundus sp. EBB-1]